jgi:disease resistance protein RPM1
VFWIDLGGEKVDDLESLGFLGSLSHLRYLRLSSSGTVGDVDRLPEEIGKLRFLQTLDLKRTEVGEAPSSFAGLTQLKCLRGGDSMGISLPDGLVKKLTSLEVLEGVTLTSECFTEEPGLLTGLRALDVTVELPEEDGLSWQVYGETMAKSLGKLHKIESLSINTDPHDPQFVMDGSVEPPLGNLRRLRIGFIKTLPTWIFNGSSVPVLSYLDVNVRRERREDMQALGTLFFQLNLLVGSNLIER